MIEPHHPKISIARQCELIGLSRSTYYREEEVRGESQENLDLMKRIDKIYTRYPFFGSRKIREMIKREGRDRYGFADEMAGDTQMKWPLG